MFTLADYSNVQYAKIDGQDVSVVGVERCFTPLREELEILVTNFDGTESFNHQFTMGFIRDGEAFELSAFVILQGVRYDHGGVNVIRFCSLGGYTVSLNNLKE